MKESKYNTSKEWKLLGEAYSSEQSRGFFGFSDKREMCLKVVGGNNYIFSCHLQVKNDCNFIANFSDISTFLQNSKYLR